MYAVLASMPDAQVHPPLTEGKTYEIRGFMGNGAVILSDNMKTLVLVLTFRMVPNDSASSRHAAS